MTYSGGTTAIFTPKVAVSGALSGQIVGGPAAVGVTSWTINSDSLDTTTGAGAPRGINDFYIGHTISAGATGGRNGVNVFLNQTGATTLAAGQFYVGVASNVVASFNAGGTSLVPNGAVMGFNPRAVLQSGATFFNSAVGMEVDFGARAGSSVSYKYGLTVVLDQLDAVDASVNSAGLVFGLNASAGPTSPGLLFGVQYGGPQNWWPINPTLGTLIGVAAPINGSGPAYTALYGVDVSAVTFSGAAFKSTGFLVDPNGRVTTTGRVKALRNVTASGSVTISSTSDEVVVINKTAGAATAVALPATPSTGRVYTIKDGKGDAAANNITISPAAGNIDGAATLVIATNYGSASLIYNGTQWNVV
ncbi:MAG TPA: hypothetical protein VN702_17620 [Acetobacteraceae bacterium]|nr:hypothetical protein [Acetobacteraceae bacterium]